MVEAFKDLRTSVNTMKEEQSSTNKQVEAVLETTTAELLEINKMFGKILANMCVQQLNTQKEITKQIADEVKTSVINEELQTKASTRKPTLPVWIKQNYDTVITEFSDYEDEVTRKYNLDAKTVKKGWVDYMKKNYKIKVKGVGLFSDKDIVEADDVTINSISDKRMNMYARVTDITGGSEMKYFMSFGYDFFIGPKEYTMEFEGMLKMLNDFSISFLNNYYADETSSILKKIKGYERDIKKNEKTITSNI